MFNIYSEESKHDNYMDDPGWIMTVKGNKPMHMAEDLPSPNHKVTQKVQNGSGPALAKSPPKDSNLNHYRSEKPIVSFYSLYFCRFKYKN